VTIRLSMGGEPAFQGNMEPAIHGPHDPSPPHPPPSARLFAYPSFRVIQDHRRKLLSVAGYIGNRGNVPASAPVKVAVVVTVRIAGELVVAERVVTIGSGLRPGALEVTNPAAEVPLVYFDEDYEAKYLFETLVDFHHDVADLSRADNYASLVWWSHSPGAVAGEEPVTFGNTATGRPDASQEAHPDVES
jgi:hypothetical protein